MFQYQGCKLYSLLILRGHLDYKHVHLHLSINQLWSVYILQFIHRMYTLYKFVHGMYAFYHFLHSIQHIHIQSTLFKNIP